MSQTPKYQVAIVDDHPMLVDGLLHIFEQHPAFEIVWTAPDAKSFRQKIEMLAPQLLILDLRLPDADGNDLLLELKKNHPEVRALGFSSVDNPLVVQTFLKNGGMGFLRKDAGKKIIVEALYSLAADEKYLQSELKEILLDWQLGVAHTSQSDIKLTRREKEILKLIADELTTSEIAEKLNLSHHTIETHRQNLLLKTGMRNTAGLIKAAIKLSLI